MQTRITVISDTHWRHDEIDLPEGDLLIHCGDLFNLFGTPSGAIAAMDAWFGRQRFERILYTGGNHDRALEAALGRQKQPMKNAYFLGDEVVEFGGLRIFGAPWVPELTTHAFFLSQADLAKAWARVPSGIDILVTHTPPEGVLDESSRGWSLGCPGLARELGRIAPRVHCFGHVHAGAGQRRVGETLFINASSIASGSGAIRRPASFTLAPREGRERFALP